MMNNTTTNNMNTNNETQTNAVEIPQQEPSPTPCARAPRRTGLKILVLVGAAVTTWLVVRACNEAVALNDVLSEFEAAMNAPGTPLVTASTTPDRI